MITKTEDYVQEQVSWRRTSDPNFPFEAHLNGDNLVLRLNDFPDSHLYTLLVNQEEVASFDDWPESWLKN